MRAIDVFGTRLLAERTPEGWRLWHPGDDGKRRPVHELPIPRFVDSDEELRRYLADLCHEGATPERPDVRWVVDAHAPDARRHPSPRAMDRVRIVATGDEHVEGFHRSVDAVARERRYLALVEGPPLEAARGWVRALREGGGVHLVAVDDERGVVGWCDVMRLPHEGFRHAGRLGMGLLPAWRGRGLGRRLAEAALEAARARGIERVELEVFASNARAIALYERLGFVREGVRRRARLLDGAYDDEVVMASLSGEAAR